MTDLPVIPRDLNQIELATLIEHFEVLTVPADIPADDFGRTVLRMSYTAGFSSALAICRRLIKEPDETRDRLIEGLYAQAHAMAAKCDGAKPS